MLLHLAVMKSCTQSLCVHHSKGNDDFYPPGLSNSSYPNPWPPQRFLSKSKISPKVLFQSLWFITRLLSKPLEGNLFVNLLGEATAGAWGTQGTHWGWTCFVLFVFEAFCTSVLPCMVRPVQLKGKFGEHQIFENSANLTRHSWYWCCYQDSINWATFRPSPKRLRSLI